MPGLKLEISDYIVRRRKKKNGKKLKKAEVSPLYGPSRFFNLQLGNSDNYQDFG